MDSNRIINGAINGAISAVLATVFIGLLTAAANLLSNGKMAEALGAVSDREMKQVISDFDKKIAPKLEACRVCFREVAKSPNQCKPQYPEAETCSGWSTSSAKGPWTQIFLLTSDIFSYKSLILLCLGCQKALHGLFSPAIVSEC